MEVTYCPAGANENHSHLRTLGIMLSGTLIAYARSVPTWMLARLLHMQVSCQPAPSLCE